MNQSATHPGAGYRHPLIKGNPPDWASAWQQDEYGVAVTFSLDGIDQRLRWIPAGAFRMGSPEGESGRYADEGPRHRVAIARGFWLFDTPVTQALWQAVMGDNPSRFQSPDRPVEQVRWEDCQAFLQRIDQRIPGLDLVLPSEAQWEYACRASEPGAIYTGALAIEGDGNAPDLDPIAWYGGNSGVDFELDEGYEVKHLNDRQFPQNPSGTHPVGRKRPNPWGLYDMLGNVWEWTADAWHDSYRGAPVDGSAWDEGEAEAGALRVVRGGSWRAYARLCRCACRRGIHPGDRLVFLGLRPARVQS